MEKQVDQKTIGDGMIRDFEGKRPQIDKSVFVAENAIVIGNVTIAPYASVWFQSVIRGDINSIRIGEYTNVQDFCMIHVPSDKSADIGQYVTVGHRALLHGCKVGNNCLIGMGSIIMDGVEIGDNCIVGAGSLVTQGTIVPAASLVLGSPAKVKKGLTPEEILQIKESAIHYFEYSRKYFSQ